MAVSVNMRLWWVFARGYVWFGLKMKCITSWPNAGMHHSSTLLYAKKCLSTRWERRWPASDFCTRCRSLICTHKHTTFVDCDWNCASRKWYSSLRSVLEVLRVSSGQHNVRSWSCCDFSSTFAQVTALERPRRASICLFIRNFQPWRETKFVKIYYRASSLGR